MKKANLTINDVFKKGSKLTFLVGAGCSVDAPSCQPAGRSMMNETIDFTCPQSETEKIKEINELRFEALVEIIRDNLDPELKVIDFYGLCEKPNIQHFFLADKINQGHFVMTTNFDFLIEHALIQIGIPKEKIKVIITKDDFFQYADPSELFSQKIKSLYKIHGSTKNIINDENTRDTLVATIQAFGSNKEGMSVFQVEPFKRQLFDNISKGRSLVVMGYSGSDDFDIVPTLKILQNIESIFWVDFVRDDGGKEKFYEIESNDKDASKSSDKINKILLEIKNMNFVNKVYRVDVNTSRMAKQLITIKPNINQENFNISPSNWFSENLDAPDEMLQYHIAQTIYFDFNLMNDSLRCAQELLRISKHSKNQIMTIKSLNLIGKVRHEQGNFSEALKLYKQALKSAEKTDKVEWKAACINNIANVYNAWGKYTDSLKYLEEALLLFEKVNDIFAKAVVLRNIGTIQKNLGNNEIALEKSTEAVQIFDQLGKLSDKADILMIIGMIQTSLGNNDAAYKNYEESLKINDQLFDFDGKIACLNVLGELFRNVGRFSEALNLLKEALNLSIRIGDLIKKASTLNNIGLIHLNLSAFSEAMKYFEEAQLIANQLNDPLTEATSYSNMGSIYFYQGDHSKATKIWEKTIKLFEKVGNQPGKTNILVNLGQVYRQKGDSKKALKVFEEATKISIQIKQPQLQAKCFENIGMILEDQKDFVESLKMYEGALALYQQVGDVIGIAGVVHNIGTIDFFQGNYAVATKKYEEAIQILRNVGAHENPLVQTIMKNIEHAKSKM
ncbi:MAG TPA: tetratricopeptide repeat protein [archaeon]|nr:tetratricopeptide repeat protein [archaeon]